MNSEFLVKKIMVVEDNPVNQKVMQKIISVIGHQFVYGGDGSKIDVLELVKIEKPDLILMDVQLIGVSGVELSKQIKETEVVANTPIIIITALASDQDREKIIKESKCNDYLAKPFFPEVLANKIANFFLIQNIKWG
jgi:two-component system cell cycle response regulator DivK